MWKIIIIMSLYLNSGVKKEASYYSDSFNGRITASGKYSTTHYQQQHI